MATILLLCYGGKKIISDTPEYRHIKTAVNLLNNPSEIHFVIGNKFRFSEEDIEDEEKKLSIFLEAKVKLTIIPQYFLPKNVYLYVRYAPYDIISLSPCMVGISYFPFDATEDEMKETGMSINIWREDYKRTHFEMVTLSQFSAMTALLENNGYIIIRNIVKAGILDPKLVTKNSRVHTYLTENRKVVGYSRKEYPNAFIGWDEKVIYKNKLTTPLEILSLEYPIDIGNNMIAFKKKNRNYSRRSRNYSEIQKRSRSK